MDFAMKPINTSPRLRRREVSGTLLGNSSYF